VPQTIYSIIITREQVEKTQHEWGKIELPKEIIVEYRLFINKFLDSLYTFKKRM
jgi:hypothetical protein